MGIRSRSGYGFVVDMVCDVCRIEGFQVEKNVPVDKYSPEQCVAILASRKNGDSTQQIAFECWEGDRQVNGRDIENFLRQLRDLKLRNGIYVSTKGFTGDAEFIARKAGLELWDLPRLRDHLERIQLGQDNEVPGTLPVSRLLASTILPRTILNGAFLRLSGMPKLEYRPYFFLEFRIHNERNRARGIMVFDGMDGRYCDGIVTEGSLRDFHTSNLFIDCLQVDPMVGSMPTLPDGLEMKQNVSLVASGTTEEALTVKLKDLLRNEYMINEHDVSVEKIQELHIPLVTVQLSCSGHSYTKMLQAATAKTIVDETITCSLCNGESRAVCQDCGRMVCLEHGRECSSCHKHMCLKCGSEKSMRRHPPLCSNCKH
jgi:hypothetical protein